MQSITRNHHNTSLLFIWMMRLENSYALQGAASLPLSLKAEQNKKVHIRCRTEDSSDSQQ
jgi:hypothetical protein